jgi:hypothetical protein
MSGSDTVQRELETNVLLQLLRGSTTLLGLLGQERVVDVGQAAFVPIGSYGNLLLV